MANPNTQRLRRSEFSTSNVIPYMVAKRARSPHFGNLKWRDLVRDNLTSICPRSRGDGLIFKFKPERGRGDIVEIEGSPEGVGAFLHAVVTTPLFSRATG